MSDSGFISRQRAGTTITDPGLWRVVPLVRAPRAAIVVTLLIAGDIVSVILATGFFDAVIGTQGTLRDPTFTTALLFFAIAYAFGLYAIPGPSKVARLRLRTIAAFSAVGLELLLYEGAYTPMVLFTKLGAAVILIVTAHYVERTLRVVLLRVGLWGDAVLIVNCDEAGRKVAAALRAHPEIGLSPLGFIASPTQHKALDSGSVDQALPLLEYTDALHTLPATLVFTSRDDMARLLENQQQGVPLRRVLLIEDISSLTTMGLRPRMIGDVAIIDISCDQRHPASTLIKRSMDLCLAVPLALIALPVIAVLACMIFLVDPGPSFYRQKRVGYRGRSIAIWKIRTMYSDAERRLEAHFAQNPCAREEWERFFKLKTDPRVLPLFGHFVRRSSLDELPQLWNVLRGDMSLVGPRPFPPYHVRAFDAEFQRLRASIKPGLTGLWQISARSNGDIGVQKEQDSTYIQKWSHWLDLYILLETLPAVLRRDGAR